MALQPLLPPAGPIAVVGVIVVAVTVLANAFFALADLARAPFVLGNSAEVGVPPRWLPALGVLKGAGAAGLALGLFGILWIGLAAGVGLVCFFAGALLAHVRAGVYYNIAFPLVMWLLALGSTAAWLAT